MCSLARFHSQGPNLGKHGIDVIPNSERFAPAPPEHFKSDVNPELLAAKPNLNGNQNGTLDEDNAAYPQREKLLPRETGHDIGMGSPVPLSAEAVQIITRLRNMKVRLTFVMYLSFCSLPILESGELTPISAPMWETNTYISLFL